MKKIFMFICMLGVLISIPIFNANATESSSDYEALFNETNNYNTILTKESETLSDGTSFDYYVNNVDFSTQNANVISEEEPIVTFLTHGLGGDDYHWAHKDLYGTNQYFSGTIVNYIQQLQESDVYLFAFEDNTNNYNISKYCYFESKDEYKWSKIKIDDLVLDNSKHSIIIFDSGVSLYSNDAVYFQFNIMVSTVLKELKEQDINNRIPKINLIGHSRGGITNLQYALDHPDIVDSMFSIGTPYFGSNSASIDFNLLFGMVAGGSGEADVTNAEKYNEYYNRWNNNYETLYKNINAHALGGYSSCKAVISQLVYFCYKELTGKEIDETHLSIVSNVINVYLNNLLYNIKEETITVEILNHIYNMIIKIVPELYNYTRFLDGILSLCDLFNDCLVFNYNEFEYDFKNDIIVDLSSQLAKNDETGQEYKGFNTYSKRYDLPSIDYTNVSTSTYPPVTHNIEAKDNDFIKYIIKNIKLSNQEKVDYLFQEIDNNSVAITSYIGDSSEDSLIIPESVVYNGKTLNVTKINDGAFSNNCNGDSNIKNIIIPNTVTYIGKNAFMDNEYLTSVKFEDGSLLEEIDDYAFSNIPNLLTFKIPSTCEVISNTAFRGSGILSFTGNSYYTWSNNFLVNNESKTAIYAKPNVTTFTVPSNVVSLGEYLFFNNKYVTSINMNNVSHIGMNCFTNSNVTNFTNITNVKKTDFESFVNTPWLENNESSEFLKFGNVLLAYNGTDTEVIVPEGIINISSNCFINNEICAIILPEATDYIGDYAFTFCDNLEWILFNSDNPPIINIDCFGEETILYVKDGLVTRYKEDLSFQFLTNTIITKSVNVKLYVDNTIYKTITETYCSNLDGFSNPTKTGYDFLYWLDSNGNIQKTGYIFKYYEDISLFAYFEKSKYTINLDNGNYTETIIITYGEQVNYRFFRSMCLGKNK